MTWSTVPINCSGLQQGSQPSKRKRSNADEHAHKRLKEEINSKIEEGEQKMKGGRGGKKVKGNKKKKHLRFEHHHIFSTILTNFTGKQVWIKHKKMQQRGRQPKHISKLLFTP